MQRRRILVIIASLAAIPALIVLQVLFSQNSISNALSIGPQVGDPWPQFVMVFQDENIDWASGQVVDHETYQFTYTGMKHWRLELIESTRNPRGAGTWSSYDGVYYRASDYGDGHPGPGFTREVENLAVATPWLVPVNPELLGTDGKFQRLVQNSTNDQIHLRQELDFPCSSLSAAWQSRLCQDGKQTYRRVTDKLLTVDHGIPTEVTERVEGRVTSRIVVKELTYTKPMDK